jgi:hypothetical protein
MVPGMFKVGGDYSDIASQYVKNFNYIQEKRRAADDAFDKYIQTQTKTVDPNAVRSVDREAFDQMYKDWVGYGVKNKKRIVSDPNAKMEFENMGRSLSRFVEDSKEQEKKKSPLSDAWRSGKVVREKAIEAIASHDQPLLIREPTTGQLIANPNRKSLDFTETIWNAKTPNIAEIVTKVGSGKKRIKIEGVPLQNDPNTVEGRDRLNRYKMLRPIKEQYTPQSVKEIGDLSADYALSDESIKNGFDFEYENIKSKPEYDALNNAYKRYYGKDQNISDGLSYARAKGVLFAEKAGDMYEEEIEDTQRLDARSQARKAQSEARADARSRARSGGTPMPTTNVFDVISTTYAGGKIEKGKVLDVNGKPVTGVITLRSGEVPAELAVPMKSIGMEVGKSNLVKVKDGVIQSIKPGRLGEVSRSMILVGQQKFDTERKGEGYKWGETDTLDLGF